MLQGHRKFLLAVLILVAIVILALSGKLNEWAAVALGTLKAMFDISNGLENYQYHQTQRKEIENEVHKLSDAALGRAATDELKSQPGAGE